MRFRTLEDVGESPFLDVMVEASKESLDTGIATNAASLREWAEQYVRELPTDNYRDGWWEVGYDDAGAAIGVVMPVARGARRSAVLPRSCIYYVAVVPEHRGKGYVHELL